MVALVEVDANVVEDLHKKLTLSHTELPEKYRILFSLRNISGTAAHKALITALQDPSNLFRHDVCFCLGQRQDAAAVEVLTKILKDANEHPMVRHEAGEALGAIGTDDCLRPLYEHMEDPMLEVAETCQLAVQKIQHAKEHPECSNSESPYYSVDPTPALPMSTPTQELREILLDENQRMFDRYSALFALRNKGGKEAIEALLAVFKSRSALLKHEVAYVLGQMQDQAAAQALVSVLQDVQEHPMVRHEAAEALGSIANNETIAMLQQYRSDAEPIVADSCLVALDMLEFENSGQFQYAATSAGNGHA